MESEGRKMQEIQPSKQITFFGFMVLTLCFFHLGNHKKMNALLILTLAQVVSELNSYFHSIMGFI